MPELKFTIEHHERATRARAGQVQTAHGLIATPGYAVAATQGAVKGLVPEALARLGVPALIANTYHLYLSPGPEAVRAAGGLHAFMGWEGPLLTDSGGFQAFSLGEAYGKPLNKFGENVSAKQKNHRFTPEGPYATDFSALPPLVKFTDEGIKFRSHRDGSEHLFTPETVVDYQNAFGSDIAFVLDECASPAASEERQRSAWERTRAWAERSLSHARKVGASPALFGIVQGGRYPALRAESARVLGQMDFAGYGIGGTFDETDLTVALAPATAALPEAKPRHLLGIGEPVDILAAVAEGVDLFDCVLPTRLARTGVLLTARGRFNLRASAGRGDYTAPDPACACSTCARFSRAYLAHLFRVNEMLGPILATTHNVYFMMELMRNIRAAILADRLPTFREDFLRQYQN
jgi:tRNA-guanine transglycosylase